MTKTESQNLASRPPIVVILGHIDHGKSSLLQAIKDFKITEKESGGITQHIGAYQVAMPAGSQEEQEKKITFLDTPGHEAFSQMRSRGAKVADIAVLVIDASEGVKVQTKEAISHIKTAGIPVIIALNKIDKPDADSEKVKRELSENGFLVESLGGKIPSIEVSAKTNKGIPELLEVILLVAEMEELQSESEKPAEGVVIESYLDNLRGPTATLLLTKGTLKTGDIIGTKTAFTKIKSLENFQKNSILEALPSTPVIIFGFNQAPKVGEGFKVFSSIEKAKDSLETQEEKEPEKSLPGEPETAGDQKILNIILKTDVLGSAEAVEGILKNLPQEQVVLKIVKSEVGSINESDLKTARGGGALILGFRVKVDPAAQKMLERERLKIMTFEVIYDLVEGVRGFMEKALSAEEVRLELGKVKVLAKFLADKNRQIIGGKIIEGEAKKGALVEVFRNEEKVGQGKIVNLQRNKKDAPSLPKGEECGILYEGNVKVEEGDILGVYAETRIKRQL
ncbi:MAG: translation initiation factor IF-2 [bacterium]